MRPDERAPATRGSRVTATARQLRLAVAVLAAVTIAACRGVDERAAAALTVADAWARPSIVDDGEGGQLRRPTTAAYLTIRNAGHAPDRLIGARSGAARAVELHRSRVEDGVVRMRPEAALEVPPRGEATLEPGGYHLMLIDPTRELRPGDHIPLVLEFESAGELLVEAEVRRP